MIIIENIMWKMLYKRLSGETLNNKGIWVTNEIRNELKTEFQCKFSQTEA